MNLSTDEEHLRYHLHHHRRGVVGLGRHHLQNEISRGLVLASAGVFDCHAAATAGFYLVRLPLNNWLVGSIGLTSSLYEWMTLFYAPLTEEPAKLIPLLAPFIFLDIRKENFVRYALVIGLGLGIGEIWFLAERIANNPSFASFSFWQSDSSTSV